MVILGISASGREVERDDEGTLLKGVTEEFVKYILENSGVCARARETTYAGSRTTGLRSATK